MDMSLSKLWDLVMDREVWHAAVHAITKNRTCLSDWTELKKDEKNQQKNWHEKTLDTTGAAYMTQKHQSPDQKLDTS